MPTTGEGGRGGIRALTRFLGISALAGALAAGLVVPIVGLAGVGTERVVDSLTSLPERLIAGAPDVRTRVLAADGSLIANLYEENRAPVGLNQIAPSMRHAIVAIEDSRFYQHGALDLQGTLRAMIRNRADGTTVQGGSSITQQYVKMTLLENARTPADQRAATALTYQRKLTELRYAIEVEQRYSKDQILDMYLNLANFGDGTYGVQAAAQHYFGVNASRLTLPESAMLAGIVKNPSGYDPVSNPGPATSRRNTVIGRMLQLGVISVGDANRALRTPVIDLSQVHPILNGCANSAYPFYCEYVVSKLLQNPALGDTPQQRDHYLKTGGLTIRTSLDPRIQAAAQKSIDEHSKPSDNTIAAVTVVEPGTGLVKAMVQSKPYGYGKHETAYNYNVEKSYPGGYGGFQNGSTMKAFTIAAAIQQGIPIDYQINSPDQIDLSNVPFRTCKGWTRDGNYTPKNSTKSGDFTMVDGARYSVNTYFLQLSEKTGLCAPATIAAKLGMYNAQTLKPLDQVVSFTLGVGYVTPLMLSNAYATFAARGVHCEPLLVTGITDQNGKSISTPAQACKQVLEPWVADGVNRVLSAVMEPGGTGGNLKFGNWALAGKTGTINKNLAVWFSGYAPNLAAAAVVADATPPYTNLIGQRLDGQDISDPTGSGTAGPIWETAMRGALQGMPRDHFTTPPDRVLGSYANNNSSSNQNSNSNQNPNQNQPTPGH
ncbi:transglycosylase domain-containing protein [Kribbella solani]|uniref:transglycosylase domain-containing protein n=1 Tax=Kribbella solani TaxID=236067 RepID=UPI0029BD3DD7|nr:transglycosylase domain-containing protein [Kribbella solani]MDX2969193.1 transglycosylase domain-containing protein [Kribbella solani]